METTARFSTRDITYIAVFTALLAVCSWISIPTTVPFTLQTFGVFLAVGLLGGKRGTLTVLTFILLAAVGAPVLSGFTGGLGILLGSTGGYILGFLLTALLMWAIEHFFGSGLLPMGVGMVLGLAVCYFFGTVWFMVIYARTEGPIGVLTALGWCVFPYLVPDLVKIGLALALTRRLRPFIK